MKLPPRIVKILCCPETKLPLEEAPADVIANLEKARGEGKLSFRNGKPVGEPIEGGLIRSDGKVLYPVLGGIPVLLVDESIALG